MRWGIRFNKSGEYAMKPILYIMTTLAVCFCVSAEEGFKPLFNGKDLSGWHSLTDQQAPDACAFSVDESNQTLHLYAGKEAGSAQEMDGLYTEKEYGDYVLKLEYKWMDKRFEPRTTHDRDSGVLFHMQGNFERLWPNCLEMQIGESDAKKMDERCTTGDLWVIGKDIQAMNEMDGSFYSPGAASVPVGKGKAYDSSYTEVNHERPHGEWNEVTLTVRGGKEAVFELNGHVVNRIKNLTYAVDGKRVPLEKGRIGLQAECAEMMYRNIRIKEFSPNAGFAQHRVWKPDVTSEFEVDTQIRAWTMQDEGMDYILDTMQQMCGINNLYMVVVMHKEHRPYQAPEFPHNPARDVWEAEDSRVTFFPDWDRYGDVKPLLSDVDWIREKDWLKLMVEACRERGIAAGAEVSHFPIPQSMVKRHPDWQQRKIDGSVWRDNRFCPNNPDVRAYVVALFGDLAANYDLDYIQTCQHLFEGNNSIEKGGTCFCPHCIAEARKMGFDLEAAIPKLQANPECQPEKDQWLDFRKHSTTEFYRLISEEIAKVKMNPKCHLRYNDTYPYRRWVLETVGMHLDEVSPYLGSLVHQDHEEQKGKKDEDFANRIAWLTKSRRLIGPDMPLICGIAPRIKATPELVKAGIRVALEHPAQINGLALKHYDGASFGLMRAFKQGMIDAGVQGLPPILGKEVEDMQLDGFSRIDDFVEEWGVETTGKGIASYELDLPSGCYDIRITYFDETKGHSNVQLLVAGQEVIQFKLDEDVGCWRWRLFKDIPVNTGDEIKLVAESDDGEHVRLDFIEFIPVEASAP
jgi:hypothetical protein